MMGPPSTAASTSTLLVDRKPVPHALWQPTQTLEPAVPPLPDTRAQSAHAAESAFRAANQDSFYHRPYDASGGPKKLRARRTIDYFGEVGKWNLVRVELVDLAGRSAELTSLPLCIPPLQLRKSRPHSRYVPHPRPDPEFVIDVSATSLAASG